MFRSKGNYSSDQLALITAMVKKRRRVLDKALNNLREAMEHIEPRPQAPVKTSVTNKISDRKPKEPKTALARVPADQKVLKGQVSYKVKGPEGQLMNIAEIKGWINSIYDGKQGIIKQ